MIQDILASGTLNLVYAGTILVCFVFVVLILIGGGIGDAFEVDLDVDADAGFDFIPVSPFALAMLGTAFGFTGIITRTWLDMEAIPSVLWAAGFGVIIGIAAQVFFIYVLSPTKSSHFTLSDDAVGRTVEVIITIPSNGIGEVAYDNISGRVKLGARSVTGLQIERGEMVVIERITGRVAAVRPE
jgi:membrane protein implicated in regulation of membrane protease activity